MTDHVTSPSAKTSCDRRTFMQQAGGATAAATLFASLGTNFAHAQGSGTVKIGVVGCGGRGTGAIGNAMEADPGVELHVVGEMFQDRVDRAVDRLKKYKDRVKVTKDNIFLGFDAYKQVLATDIDYVILATPPGFRPIHAKAAVEAGKNVFMEKPVAVDPWGIREVMAAADIADQKKLSMVAGTQRRHTKAYIETIKRIHDGAIGEILAGRCYWNMGGLWVTRRQPGWSDMEWQLRNWLYFTWLSGDHIVEQHVHNIDVMNWVLQDHPVRCVAVGGRQARTAPEYGHIFDHFAVDFEYANGVHVMSMCRQQSGCDGKVGEDVVGAKGTAQPQGSIRGAEKWRFRERAPSGYVQEHADLIAAMRNGPPLNEGHRVAESTLTAIMGRMAAYTGKVVTWEKALNSKLDLRPPKYEMGPLPVPEVAIPGKTKLI